MRKLKSLDETIKDLDHLLDDRKRAVRRNECNDL